MNETELWAFGIVATVIGGIYFLLYKQQIKITEIATDMRSMKEEILRLRDMRHEIIEHTTQALAEWHSEIIEKIKK